MAMAKDLKVCGLAGKTARASARSMLLGQEVNKKAAEAAVSHINGCDYCKTRIKNDIHAARVGEKKKAYLDSLPETLEELQPTTMPSWPSIIRFRFNSPTAPFGAA